MDGWQVLCLFFGFTAIAMAREHHATFSSFKAPNAEVLQYEIVVPRISPQPPKKMSVILNTKAFRYKLQVFLNEGLLSTSFLSRFHSSMGQEAVQDHDHCFYHGTVEGEPEWTVVLSTCLGLRGSFGPRGDPKLRYHIEPLYYHLGSAELTQLHVLYHGSEYSTRNGTCETKGHQRHGDRHHHIKLLEKQQVRRQGRFAIVEWTLVNDHAQYIYFGNLTVVVLRAIEIANGVDDIFKVQGVRIVVVDVVTWTMGDPIAATSNAGGFLDNFRDYSHNLPQHYDSAMLFTGIPFEGNTIGIAFTATICATPRSAVGLVYDGGGELDQLMSTTAHELGHIFAMDHDDRTCLCEGEPSGVCIMNATLGNPTPKIWSSCSVETLHTSLAGELGLCLDNKPDTTVTDPACGNGIKEEGEACDCGSTSECIDPCCNATSCQLVAGAECRAGPCCEKNCRFKAYGSICRKVKNDCDIEEYCTGHHSECPRDFFLQEFSPCRSNNSYCFSGECQTRDKQCQHHFGTNDAVDDCYTSMNTRGNVNGHCGFNGATYKPCLERNAFCGQIQCEDGGVLQTTPGDQKRARLPFSPFICNTVTTEAGSDEISPGLVRDGTKCGDERVCLNTECVNVTSVDVPSCPVDSISSKVCSGRGVCNNENQCSCSVGYTGSVCGAVVGAEHQKDRSGVNGGVVAAAVIGTVMVFVVVIIAVFVIFLVLNSKSLFSQATGRTQERSPEPASGQSQAHLSVKHIPARPAPPAPSNPNATKSFPPKRPPPLPTKPVPPPKPSVSMTKTSDLSYGKPPKQIFVKT